MDQSKSPPRIIPFLVRYGIATLLVAAALGATLLISLVITSIASPLFLLAIVITAWRYGMRPGIFATLLSGVAIDYFFVAPAYQLSGAWDDILRLIIFAGEGYVLCWLVTSRTKASEEIERSRERLQALSLRQQALIEAERKRIALEIHDELGQNLTGLKMDMHMLNKRIAVPGATVDVGEASQRMNEMMDVVDQTILNVRRIATELRPPILDDLGLVAAIEWQTQEFQRRTEITCVLSSNIENVEINADFSTAIFRIFQEALTNITRHANANTVNVILKRLDHKLVLRVEDDGNGIRSESFDENRSLGLLGMRERARLIGGELEIFDGTDNGTTVLLTAPLG